MGTLGRINGQIVDNAMWHELMPEPVTFQPNDAYYLSCIGASVTFETAWHAYCFIDRVCFPTQCDDPAFAKFRVSMHAAVQRGINAGFVLLSSSNKLSLSNDLRTRLRILRDAGKNEFDAAEELDTFLRSQPWDVVSTCKLPP